MVLKRIFRQIYGLQQDKVSRLSTLAYTWRRYEEEKRNVSSTLEEAEADVERPLVPASKDAVLEEIRVKRKLLSDLDELDDPMAAVTTLNATLKVVGLSLSHT